MNDINVTAKTVAREYAKGIGEPLSAVTGNLHDDVSNAALKLAGHIAAVMFVYKATPQEIAERLGLPESWVSKLLQRYDIA